jgi:hypothetical protein
MPRQPTTKLIRKGPPKHEWFFADKTLLPDDQTSAAYNWEFGLETPEVIAEVEAVREKKVLSEKVDMNAVRKWHAANPYPGVCETKQSNEWLTRFNRQFPDYIVTMKFRDGITGFLINWPEFPSQHWLQVPEKLRADKKRLRPLKNQIDWQGDMLKAETWLKRGEATKFDTEPSFFFKTYTGLCCHTSTSSLLSSGLDFWPNWKATTKSPWGFASADGWDELRLVKLNWARSDRKLKADFAEWLKENRPDDRQPFHELREDDSRRTTERELLKALGALRLLRHFQGDWGAAAGYSGSFCKDKQGKAKPLYAEQSEWRDAEKRVQKALGEFQKKVFG